MASTVDVLIPTLGRPTALAVTLASLLGQTLKDYSVIISDQTDEASPLDSVEIQNLIAALRWHGHRVETYQGRPRRGMAEQRNFLLESSTAPYVHFIDDDVILDPPVLERMLRVLREEGCGFVGCAHAGLRYLDDLRPDQQHIEIWDGPVRPEPITPESIPWQRVPLHNAANALHVERQLIQSDNQVIRYKIAWAAGANVLFDRAKLLEVGGFSFWPELPAEHAGEEVLVQFLLLRTYGGCGLLPCGTYHMCLPTNVPDRRHNAIELFGQKLRELGLEEPVTTSSKSESQSDRNLVRP